MEERKAQIFEEKKERKARREKKRQRLGLYKDRRTGEWLQEECLTSSDGVLVDVSSDEEPLRAQSRRKARKSSTITSVESDGSDNRPYFRKHAKRARTEGRSAASRKDVTEGEQIDPVKKKGSVNRSGYSGTATEPSKAVGQKQARPLRRMSEPKQNTGSSAASKAAPVRKPSMNPSKASLRTGESRLEGVDILKNWNKPPKPRKRTLNEANVNKTFGKLSIQRRVQQAAAREPAPDMQALRFVNLEDGKVMPKGNQNTGPRELQKTPFQMIQDQLTNKDAQQMETNPQIADIRESPGPMDMDAEENEPLLFVDEMQIEPQATTKETSNISASENTALFTSERLEHPVPLLAAGDPMNANTQAPEESSEAATEDTVSSATGAATVRNANVSMKYSTASNTIKAPSGDKVNHATAREQRISTTFPKPVQSPSHKDRMLSASSADGDNPQMPYASETRRPKLPAHLEPFMGIKAFAKLVGDWGMSKPWNSSAIDKGDFSDVLGELLAEGESEEVTSVIIRGLTRPARELLMTVKDSRGPRVRIHEFCNLEEYIQRYHGVSEIRRQ